MERLPSLKEKRLRVTQKIRREINIRCKRRRNEVFVCLTIVCPGGPVLPDDCLPQPGGRGAADGGTTER